MAEAHPARQGGPYLQIAAICEQVIEGKDGVLSLIRVIDRVIHQVGVIGPPGVPIPADAPRPPEEMPEVTHSFVIVVSLKAGQVRGSHQIRFELVKPDMSAEPVSQQDLFFEGGEDRGANVVLRLSWTFKIPGLHWFDLYFDDDLLARMPMRIVYLRS